MNAASASLETALLQPVRLRRVSWAKLKWSASAISPVLLLVVWTLVTRAHWFSDRLLVPPRDVWSAFLELCESGELSEDLRISLLRLACGFGLGSLGGLVLGVLLEKSSRARSYVGPLFQALRQVPTLALIPMFILLFGIGETLKIVIIVKSTLYPVAVATMDGVRNIPEHYLEVGRAYRLSPWASFKRILFPAAVPPILTGVRIALGRSWMVLVAIELLTADTGLGQTMETGRQMLRLDIVMVGVIVTGVIGFALDRGLELLERALVPWKAR
jgi:sulfonate transport system permease protein